MAKAETAYGEAMTSLATPAQYAEVEASLAGAYPRGTVPHFAGYLAYLTARLTGMSHAAAIVIAQCQASQALAEGLERGRRHE